MVEWSHSSGMGGIRRAAVTNSTALAGGWGKELVSSGCAARPTLLMARGLRPLTSVTPLTFLVERCAKKMCTRALCVSSAAAAAKHCPSCGKRTR